MPLSQPHCWIKIENSKVSTHLLDLESTPSRSCLLLCYLLCLLPTVASSPASIPLPLPRRCSTRSTYLTSLTDAPRRRYPRRPALWCSRPLPPTQAGRPDNPLSASEPKVARREIECPL